MVDIKNPSYTYTKRNFFYFSRAVPKDLRDHYKTNRIVISLRTKSAYRANIASRNLSAKLEDYWLGLRLKGYSFPEIKNGLDIPSTTGISNCPSILEAQDKYLTVKGESRSPLFFSHTKRAVNYLIENVGSKKIDEYSGLDAANFRDSLKNRGLNSSSIKRNISCIKAIINFNINEYGLVCNNGFSNVFIQDDEKIKRHAIKVDSISKLQH